VLYYCATLKDGEILKFIYHCYGGTHSSVTAAAVHLGWLPWIDIPSPGVIQGIPHFDTQDSCNHGQITFMGRDENNNQVYIVGRRDKPQVLEGILSELSESFNIPRQDFRLINVMPAVNISMRIGGILSRRFKLVNLGRPLVTRGTLKALPNIQRLVANVKNNWETK